MRIAQDLARMPLTTLVHLTLVGHTEAELVEILSDYASLGLSNLLALRGDPPGADPLGEWTPVPGGYRYAEELIWLTKRLEATKHFQVGIAAFPEGHHQSESLAADTKYTLAKLRAGAEFSITQMFFDVDYYLRLRDRPAAGDYADHLAEVGAAPIAAVGGEITGPVGGTVGGGRCGGRGGESGRDSQGWD